MYKRLLLGLVLCLCFGGVQAGHLELEKVSESVFLVLPATGDSTSQSNAAFVLLPDGILLFDTLSSAELLQEMLELIAKVSDLPINRVVLSHFHPDHSGGLVALRERDLGLYVGPTTTESFNRSRSTKLGLLQRILREPRTLELLAQSYVFTTEFFHRGGPVTAISVAGVGLHIALHKCLKYIEI